MADKKRKVTTAIPEPPTKKSKKSSTIQAKSQQGANDPRPDTAMADKETKNEVAVESKRSRKRAADFLTDDAESSTLPTTVDSKVEKSKKSKVAVEPANNTKATTTKLGKKHKKSGTPAEKEKSLTADGVNGVIENDGGPEVQLANGDGPAATSLQAEAIRTADQEMQDEFGGEDEVEVGDDQGAALLAGFDSDNEDDAEDQGLDTSKDIRTTQPIPNYKKTTKKLRQAAEKGKDGPGVVYVGRIPHGFYEQQMREYFGQFGNITRLRLSRNKRTGASKHFAFIEFDSDEVAKIVADTMDNYLMFGHILKCKYAPKDNLHPDVWKGANKRYRKIPHTKLEREKLEAPKTTEQWERKNKKEQHKRLAKAEKLRQIGYEMVVPTLEEPSAVVRNKQLEQPAEVTKAITEGVDDPATEKSVVAPTEEIPAKKVKKGKKSTSATGEASNALTEDNLGAQNADNAMQAVQAGKKPKSGSKAGTTTSVTPVNITNGQSVADSEKVAVPEPAKKGKKPSKAVSVAGSTDKGDYDTLSSIPVGVEAIPELARDAAEAENTNLNTLLSKNVSTTTGIADAELKKRKKDRREASKASKGSTHAMKEVPEKASTKQKSKTKVEESGVGSEEKNEGRRKRTKV